MIKFKNLKPRELLVLKKNYASLTLLQLTIYALPLITIPYLIKTLGVDKFGIVVFFQSIFAFAIVFVDYGFNLFGTREISVHREEPQTINEIFSVIMTIKFMLVLITFAFLFFIKDLIYPNDETSKFIYFGYLIILGQALFPVWYFQGLEKMFFITILNMANKIIATILIFTLIKNPSQYEQVILIYGVTSLSFGILSLLIITIHFKQKFSCPTIALIVRYLREGSYFFLSRMSSVGYTNLNTLIAGLLLSPTVVAYYYLAEKIVQTIISFIDPLVQSIFPYFSRNNNTEFLFALAKITLSIALLVTVLLNIISGHVSDFFLGHRVGSFEYLLHALSILIPVSVSYILLGAPLLLARGYKKEFNLSIVYGFFCHVFLVSFLLLINSLNILPGEFLIYLLALVIVFSKFITLCIRVFYVKRLKLL